MSNSEITNIHTKLEEKEITDNECCAKLIDHWNL